MDRTTRIAPLGVQRIRLLECLGGNDPRAAGYFALDDTADVFTAFGHYVARLSTLMAGELDSKAVSLLAAARLLTGELSAAVSIVEQFPVRPVTLDHGAGVCLVLPINVLKTSLPLPVDLMDTSRWTAGSNEQAALRVWLDQHRNLLWVAQDGHYRLAG